MNSKNWYFLGFSSLVAWAYFLSQDFCAVWAGNASGFDLLLNLIFERGSYLEIDHVLKNVVQALILTVAFLGLAVFSFLKGRELAQKSDNER